MNIKKGLRLILLSEVICLLTITHSYSQSAWTPKGKFESTPRVSATGFSIGTKAYIGTGYDSTSVKNDFWQWDVCSNTWTQESDFPGVPRSGCISFSVEGNGYVGLGWNNRQGGFPIFYSDLYEYNPTQNSWTEKASLSGGGREEASCFTVGNQVYVGVGYDGSSLDDFWEYDVANDNWEQKANFAGHPRRDAVSFSIKGKGYIGTGYDESTGCMSDFWEYDTATNAWLQKALFGGGPRNVAVGFSIGDKGYVGIGNDNGTLVNDFWSWVQAANTWTRKPDFPGAARETAVNFSIGCKSYVGLGGLYLSLPNLRDFWEFYDSTNTVSCSSLNAGSDVTICNGSATTLNANGANSSFDYSWSPATGLSSDSVANPIASPSITTTYTLTTTDPTVCFGQAEVLVNVIPNVIISPAPDTSICLGNTVMLNAVDTGANSYLWSPSSGLSCTSCENPLASPSATTKYTVIASNSYCSNTASTTVNVFNGGFGGVIKALRDTICQGTDGSLTLLSDSSGGTIQWQSSTTENNFTDITNATATSYKTTPLYQSTFYRVKSDNGQCPALSDTLELIVQPPLIAYFSFSAPGIGNAVRFNSDSSKGAIVRYYWSFGDGANSDSANPTHTYAKDSTYYACLTLFDGSNCSYTYCKYVSPETGIDPVSPNSGWTIYPNPFTSDLTICRSKTGEPIANIEIYDVLGRLVMNVEAETGYTPISLNVSALAKGMYYVKIRTANLNNVQKLVKQ